MSEEFWLAPLYSDYIKERFKKNVIFPCFMTKTKSLDLLISSHLIACRGINCNNNPLLPKENAEPVIVNIYKNGTSSPLCRYYSGRDKKCSVHHNDESQGRCPYKDDCGELKLA